MRRGVALVECTCGDVCHLYSHTYICYALTLPLTLLALFVIISIFLHAVMQDKRLECFARFGFVGLKSDLRYYRILHPKHTAG